MSDKGRVFAHDDATECPRCSPKLVLIMPPRPDTRLQSVSDEVRNDELLARSCNECGSDGWSLPDSGCERPDPFSSRPAISEKVIVAYRQPLGRVLKVRDAAW